METKTIQERANALYQGDNTALNVVGIDGYIRGATEQQEIDIQRVCDWMNENFGVNISTKFVTEVGVMGFIEVPKTEVIDAFKKFMKGE